MIDNIERIRPLLIFDSEDDFYYLQLLMRKKENPELGSNSRVIKNYYIKSIEHLDKLYPEIKTLCKTFNARAMLRLNKRSFYQVSFKALINMAATMSNKDYSHMRSQYDKACGQSHNDKNKTWIIDLDEDNAAEKLIRKITEHLNDVMPMVENKIIARIPTKNGMHLIVKPFDTSYFGVYFDVDLHKDNPTNLYIP